jgi:NCAIR mutase (PurE)-related protein
MRVLRILSRKSCGDVLLRRHGKQLTARNSSSSLADILSRVQQQDLSPQDAAKLISSSAGDDSDEILQSFANLDHHRAQRTGFPEAVFAQGKTPQQVARILDDMARHVNEELIGSNEEETETSRTILATRVTPEMFNELSSIELKHGTIQYHNVAQIVSMEASSSAQRLISESSLPKRRIVVATAGTTDLPVAEEAAITLEAAGCKVDRIYDAGVAGLHRIVRAIPRLRHPDVGCVIVCAGMDGALPSVIGGLVSTPVIAVPTSIGYGASFGGVSALLTMLNSCSPGVAVVNIDNGFGAAAMAFKCVGLAQPASGTK